MIAYKNLGYMNNFVKKWGFSVVRQKRHRANILGIWPSTLRDRPIKAWVPLVSCWRERKIGCHESSEVSSIVN